MTESLWTAVRAQASVWQRTPVVQRFVSPLPQPSTPGSRGLARLLNEIDAGIAILNRPLRMASSLNLAGQFHATQLARIQARYSAWLRDAARVEIAHRQSVAWLRARLPGYPMLPVPQLVAGSSLTTNEFTFDLVWPRQDFAAGLQFVDPLPNVAAALEASGEIRAELEQAARDLVVNFAVTSEWQRFLTATNELDEAGRKQLREARQRLTAKLAPAAVDAHEPQLAMPRNDYRLSAVDEQIKQLDGSAREYADSFGHVDALITRTASDVFGQLLCFEVLDVAAEELERHLDDPTRVTFQCDDQRWFKPGVILALSDPSVPDLVFATSLNHNWSQTGQMHTVVSGQVLLGSRVLR